MMGGLLAVASSFLLTRRVQWSVFLLLGAVALVTLLMATVTEFPEFAWNRYGRSLVSLLAPWLMLAVVPERRDRIPMLALWSAVPIAMVLTGSLYQALGWHELWTVDNYGNARLQGSSIPAGLGSAAYVASFASLLGFAVKRSTGWALLTVANIIILLLTAARAPAVLAVFLLTATYLTCFRQTRSTATAGLLAIPVLIGGLMWYFGEPLVTRLLDPSLSGREALWGWLREVLHSYSLFGIGLGHQILVLPTYITDRTQTLSAHNEYLRLAVECGYLGATLVFAGLLAVCFTVWRSSRVNFHLVFLAAVLTFFMWAWTDPVLSSQGAIFLLVAASFAFPGRDRPKVGSRQTAAP